MATKRTTSDRETPKAPCHSPPSDPGWAPESGEPELFKPGDEETSPKSKDKKSDEHGQAGDDRGKGSAQPE